MKAIAVTTKSAPHSVLLTHFLPDQLSEAFAKAGWTPEHKVGLLVDIAEGAERDADRIKATEVLDRMMRESLQLSGQIQELTAHAVRTGLDGEEITLQSRTMRLLEGVSADAMSVLDAPSRPLKRVEQDDPESEEDNEEETGTTPQAPEAGDEFHLPPTKGQQRGLAG